MASLFRQSFSILSFVILMSFYSYGQTILKSRGGLTGNNIVEFVQDKSNKEFFTDPVDDTINFKKVVDNIFRDRIGKIYILNVSFRPGSNDTSVYLEYFKDISGFLDLKSYRQIKHGFFQNKGKVFTWGSNSDGDYPVEVTGADPRTFVPFDSVGGGTDEYHVFYGGVPDDFEIIMGADPKTIKVLNPDRGCWNCGNCYFVDDKSVYFGLVKIEAADPKTFKLVNKETIDAEDKNGKYFEGKAVQ
jgi:hypothetical protein